MNIIYRVPYYTVRIRYTTLAKWNESRSQELSFDVYHILYMTLASWVRTRGVFLLEKGGSLKESGGTEYIHHRELCQKGIWINFLYNDNNDIQYMTRASPAGSATAELYVSKIGNQNFDDLRPCQMIFFGRILLSFVFYNNDNFYRFTKYRKHASAL